jgi:hypothetical protein
MNLRYTLNPVSTLTAIGVHSSWVAFPSSLLVVTCRTFVVDLLSGWGPGLLGDLACLISGGNYVSRLCYQRIFGRGAANIEELSSPVEIYQAVDSVICSPSSAVYPYKLTRQSRR